MNKEQQLYEVLKEINKYTKRKAEGKCTDVEVRKGEDLIKSIYEIKWETNFKSKRDNSSKQVKHLVNIKQGQIKRYKWKYNQLNSIYFSSLQKYGGEDREKDGIKYRENLNIDEIFSIMLNKICYLWEDSFEFKSEGELVNYLKKRITGQIANEWQNKNELYIKNNFKAESLDEILLQNEYIANLENNTYYKELTMTREYKDSVKKNKKDMENLSYNEMWEDIFKYSENEKLRVIPDNEKDYSNTYLCWTRRFWDGNLDYDKQTLKILSDKDIDLHISRHDEIKFYISQFRNYLTSSQVEKVLKLKMAMEEEGEELVNCNCSSIKNEDGIYTYSDNYFKLNLVAVGKILYPSRKGNCNKDIEQFIESCRSRFTKYLIKNKKEYLIKDIPILENIA